MACIGVREPFPELTGVDVGTISGGPVAWLDHYGAYEELGLATMPSPLGLKNMAMSNVMQCEKFISMIHR